MTEVMAPKHGEWAFSLSLQKAQRLSAECSPGHGQVRIAAADQGSTPPEVLGDELAQFSPGLQ